MPVYLKEGGGSPSQANTPRQPVNAKTDYGNTFGQYASDLGKQSLGWLLGGAGAPADILKSLPNQIPYAKLLGGAFGGPVGAEVGPVLASYLGAPTHVQTPEFIQQARIPYQAFGPMSDVMQALGGLAGMPKGIQLPSSEDIEKAVLPERLVEPKGPIEEYLQMGAHGVIPTIVSGGGKAGLTLAELGLQQFGNLGAMGVKALGGPGWLQAAAATGLSLGTNYLAHMPVSKVSAIAEKQAGNYTKRAANLGQKIQSATQPLINKLDELGPKAAEFSSGTVASVLKKVKKNIQRVDEKEEISRLKRLDEKRKNLYSKADVAAKDLNINIAPDPFEQLSAQTDMLGVGVDRRTMDNLAKGESILSPKSGVTSIENARNAKKFFNKRIKDAVSPDQANIYKQAVGIINEKIEEIAAKNPKFGVPYKKAEDISKKMVAGPEKTKVSNILSAKKTLEDAIENSTHKGHIGIYQEALDSIDNELKQIGGKHPEFGQLFNNAEELKTAVKARSPVSKFLENSVVKTIIGSSPIGMAALKYAFGLKKLPKWAIGSVAAAGLGAHEVSRAWDFYSKSPLAREFLYDFGKQTLKKNTSAAINALSNYSREANKYESLPQNKRGHVYMKD